MRLKLFKETLNARQLLCKRIKALLSQTIKIYLFIYLFE